ncbi:10391_t:CDS:2 [Entrophospora sp. SA101]|nr:10391_t:CDS:2 [Entrophospora sp. SA101]
MFLKRKLEDSDEENEVDADEEDEQEFGDDKEYYYRKNEDDDIQLMTKEQNEIISNLNSFLNEMTRLFLARIETSKPKKIAKELKNYMILNNINHTELFNVIYTDYINDLNIKIMLGFLCQYGIGVKRDEEKAFDIYTNLLLLNCKESKIIYYLLGMCYQYGTDIKKEYCEAFECYLKSAEEKNSNGQYRLGFCYQYGIGTKKNYNKAFQWYLKCAENQNSVGEYNIGCCYQFGIGIQQDYEEAFEWYLKSANHEDSDGQCNVGYCYHFGIGIEKDENKAFEWYLKSAEDENSNGHNQLGHCYQYGIGKEKNYNQAFQWYLKSAENQNSVGQYNVGYCYHHGIGIQQDLDRAFQWYSKSAENGNRNGQNQLGYCYQDGIGTEEDTYMATKWFKNASNNKRDNWNISIEENTTIGSHKIPLQPPTIKRPNIKNFNMGDFFNEILELFMTKIEINNHHHVTKILMNYITQNDANSIELFDYMQDCDDDVNVNNIKLILGFFYQCGIGTKIDAKIAFNIYLNLSNYGVKDKIVGYLLGYCYHHGIGIQQDLNQAFQWYLISAENGNSNAQRNVGCCYHYEIDEIRDYNKAFEWYLKSAENGNGGAQFIVGFCYHYVIGVEKNYGKAFEWYLKSAEKGNSNGQYSVGYCYHYGIGTKKNYNKAFQWYLMSAENMNSNGQNSVGYCYENKIGTERDVDKATKWYKMASRHGHSNSNIEIVQLEYLLPEPLFRTSGYSWDYQKSNELRELLRTTITEYYKNYTKQQLDKSTTPLFFMIAGAGEGKSRNANELPNILHEEFASHEELKKRFENALVFNISFENGTKIDLLEECNAVTAIAKRMLFQLEKHKGGWMEALRKYPDVSPDEVVSKIAKHQNVQPKDLTIIIVIDGMQAAIHQEDNGVNKSSLFYSCMTVLNNFAASGPFVIGCSTATLSRPFHVFVSASHQKRVFLPIPSLSPPKRQ